MLSGCRRHCPLSGFRGSRAASVRQCQTQSTSKPEPERKLVMPTTPPEPAPATIRRLALRCEHRRTLVDDRTALTNRLGGHPQRLLPAGPGHRGATGGVATDSRGLRPADHGDLFPARQPRLLRRAALGRPGAGTAPGGGLRHPARPVAQPQGLPDYSGVAPVTKLSGQQRTVHCRWVRPKFLHQTLVEFASCSIGQCEWAALL